MPTGKAYVDPVLTGISQAWMNADDAFLSEQIFPVVEVDKPTGIYFEYGKEGLRAPGSTVRTGRGKTPEASYSRSQKNYGPLQEHDLKDYITWEEYKTYDNPLDPETDAVNFLNQQMMLEKEVAIAAKLNNTSIVTANVDLSSTPTAQWNDYNNSQPFATMQTGIDTMVKYGLKAPNTIVLQYEVWSKLQHHPDLLDRVKYSTLGILTKEMFLKLFAESGITNLLIARAVNDTAAPGLTSSLGFVWPKMCLMAYINPSKKPQLREVNGGYTLTLKEGKYVDRWTDEDEKCEYIRNNDFYEQKLIGADVFYLIKNAIA